MLWLNLKEGRETVTLQVEKPNEHFTLQVRHREREIDIHKTTVLPGGTKTYETLFKISFQALMRLAVHARKEWRRIEPTLHDPADFIQQLGLEYRNPGWFRRHRMVAMVGGIEKLTELPLFRSKNRGRQLRIAEGLETLDPNSVFLQIDSRLPPGIYTATRRKKGGTGVFGGVLAVLSGETKRYLWVPRKTSSKLMKQVAKVLHAEMARNNGPGMHQLVREIEKAYPHMDLAPE